MLGRGPKVSWCAPTLLLAISLARPATAGLSARLVYLRSGEAESCPDRAALKKAVATRLGYDPFLLSAPHTIVAEVSGAAGQLRARARLLDEGGIVLGSRELTGSGADCAELISSLALAISLTLDPMAVTAEPEPEASNRTDESAPETAPGSELQSGSQDVKTGAATDEAAAGKRAEEPDAAPKVGAVTAPPQTNKKNRLFLQAGPLGGVGWLPAWSPGGAIGVGLKRDFLSLQIDVTALLPRSESVDAGLTAKVWLGYFTLAPCVWGGRFAVCPVATLGRYSGEGSGVDNPRSGSHWHAAAGLRAVAAIRFAEQWDLVLSGDGLRTLTRPQFLVAGQEVFRPAAWAASLGVFARWQLPL